MDPTVKLVRRPSVSAAGARPSRHASLTPRERIYLALELGRQGRWLEQRARNGRTRNISAR
jgi:hypothetical protein